MSDIHYPIAMCTVKYPDGSEITGEFMYHKDNWIGMRLPGETRVDEYPAELCRIWDFRYSNKY